MENKTQAEMQAIIESFGTRQSSSNPFIRILDGTKEEAEAIFNILRNGHPEVTSPTIPNITYFYPVMGDESHKIQLRVGNSSSGANATLDFLGLNIDQDNMIIQKSNFNN